MRATTLLVAALVALNGCSGSGDDDTASQPPDDDSANPSTVGYWTSADGVFDEHGRQLLLRGINVPTQDSDPEDLSLIASWGNNIVRQLYFWSDVEPVEGQYDEAFLNQLDRQLEMARNAGMFVLIDHHQHCYGDGFGLDGCAAPACSWEHDPATGTVRYTISAAGEYTFVLTPS